MTEEEERVTSPYISIEKSQTLLLNEQSRLLESEGKKVYKLGFGQSPFSPPAFVIEALKKNAGQHYYSSVQGIPALREAIAEFHSKLHGMEISARSVFVAPGSKALLYSIMACYEEAEIFIPAPAWVSYAPQAKMLRHAATRVNTTYDELWRVTAENLEAALQKRQRPGVPSILILNYPGNPDGLTYTASQLGALAAVTRKHNILVISDEIYGLLHHDGEHTSIAKYYPEGTIITTGLSKWCGAGGWRLGAAILPETVEKEFVECLLGIASETYSCAATPVQLAAIEAYRGGERTMDYIRHQRRILQSLGKTCQGILADAGIQVHSPEGGFYLFVDFMPLKAALARRGVQTSEQLCEQLLAETGVALLPSTAFGIPSEYISARLAYVDFNGNAALAASEKLGLDTPLPENFLDTYCSHVVEGVAAIADWAATAVEAKRA